MSLQASVATLTYGLEHLPEVAKSFAADHAQLEGLRDFRSTSRWMNLWRAMRLPVWPRSDLRMLTRCSSIPSVAVDDATFNNRLRGNPNLSPWLKSAL